MAWQEGAMGDAWMSFGAQALHYFGREHEEVRRTPLGGAAAWRGSDLRERDDWIVHLGAADVAELAAAVAHVRGRGLAMGELRRADFPLPTLAPRIRGWIDELRGGRGFLLLRALPVADWGDDDSALAYWGLGQHLGRPGAQNPAGELLGHVVDTGEDAANPFVRRYRTAADIAYHCDLADVVGLLCLRQARRGGASRIVSSVSVYDELLRRRPDLVDRLYEPFLLDTRDEEGEGRLPWVPVPPCRYAGGRLRTFYHSDYFRSVERHPQAPRFTAAERELMDLYEAIANDPALYLDMDLQPGDIQLISNHTILHARTAYEDDPGHRRHLLRLWLSLE
ncbi:MAG TPA: TauD/TfdA family dioxygenase [Candidatus Dormibacteraeota bacterium]|nr:TauD/TfdA family dioxygenase [Candidatus Dormibacteraeota bacterium]